MWPLATACRTFNRRKLPTLSDSSWDPRRPLWSFCERNQGRIPSRQACAADTAWPPIHISAPAAQLSPKPSYSHHKARWLVLAPAARTKGPVKQHGMHRLFTKTVPYLIHGQAGLFCIDSSSQEDRILKCWCDVVVDGRQYCCPLQQWPSNMVFGFRLSTICSSQKNGIMQWQDFSLLIRYWLNSDAAHQRINCLISFNSAFAVLPHGLLHCIKAKLIWIVHGSSINLWAKQGISSGNGSCQIHYDISASSQMLYTATVW